MVLNDDKLLLKVAEPGEDILIPPGGYGGDPASEFALALTEDGRMALYQSVERIIWDCDKRPLTSRDEE